MFLGKWVIEPVMHVDNDIGEWNLAWMASGIPISDMVYLAVQYWLSKPLTLTVVMEMLNFHRVIDMICNTNSRHFYYNKCSLNTFICIYFFFYVRRKEI